MFDAPIGEGANLFIWIVVFIIAFVAGLMHVDIFKAFNKKPDQEEQH